MLSSVVYIARLANQHSPSLMPMVNPSGLNLAISLLRTFATTCQTIACISSDRSNTLPTCCLGTTSVCPSVTGNVSELTLSEEAVFLQTTERTILLIEEKLKTAIFF